MDFKKLFQSLSKLELALLIIFVLYIALPIQTPDFFAGLVDSSLGMLTIFVITVYLFFNVNPIVAVVYIFVAYELLRRSSNKTGTVTIVQHTPSQANKDSEMIAMNPVQVTTLEEEVVQQMAPIGKSDPGMFISTSFKPVADKVGDASLYR
jgi:hypothetical protein